MDEKRLSDTDHAIAIDMLFEAKAAVKDFGAAITETTSSEIRHFLIRELKNAINEHEEIYGFLQNRGIYDAYNVEAQLQKDIEYANKALQ